MYKDVEGPTKPVEDLNKICHQIPVHLILGEVDDLMYVNFIYLSSALNFIVFFFFFFFFFNHGFPHISIFLPDLNMSIKPL